MNVLAIDPGNKQSAYARIDVATRKPWEVAILDNEDLRSELGALSRDCLVTIEWISSYGMAVGSEVFDTCMWVGRFVERIVELARPTPDLVTRGVVKMHHCHSSRAKDGNVIQALVDRFAPGESNKGKGTKAKPGWFFGFHDDIWQAYALGVYKADVETGGVW